MVNHGGDSWLIFGYFLMFGKLAEIRHEILSLD
jgi:hypothetical protein